MKREQIKKYFQPFPRWTVWLIGIGLPLLALKGAGLIPIGIGVAGLVLARRPSDAQMDAWLADDIEMLKPKALAKTGIDASELVQDQYPLIGFPLRDIANAYEARRKGGDNVVRVTPITVTILNFTANQIVVYECVFDRTTGKALNESAHEYFYKHVVGVRTRVICETRVKGGETVQEELGEMFELTTAAGTCVQVLLQSRKIIEMVGGGDVPMTYAERAIQAVRKMLREKHSMVA